MHKVEVKQDLVKYAHNRESLKHNKIHYTPSQIDKLIANISMFSKSNDKKDQELEKIGVYRLKTKQVSNAKFIMSYDNSGDVNVNNPDIYFDSGNNGWVIGMSVHWTNDSWYDAGGEEAFGVYLYNMSGPTSKLAIQSTYAQLCDEDNNNTSYSYSRIPGSPSYGYGLRAQDKMVIGWPNWKYVGANIYASARYNNAFGLCHGIAQSFYEHTFSKCQLSSASMTSSGPSFTFSNGSDHFSAACKSDVTF